ncbi:LysM peptidoglycan-binding domain-containing protein [Actinoplanes sp. LDG1-06]|uniref:LysM peptidoglycan-binding domain-containing protein n=1 Tax=Paractinoplanes ovalisporus TaxID=2810368 RepID=A0ABS2A2B9_9ACTN|nr:LysM domain-containing protein [Actinoplanes ovalisporus]MBM2613995.1 LysM peptidoglycan-binding domain-containing protein [Actinoplanes ovalisporus]
MTVQRGLFFGSPTVSNLVGAAVALVRGSEGVHVTRAGDTLSALAGQYLGDPALWRDIARANGIDDPLNLPPGQALVIPAREGR